MKLVTYQYEGRTSVGAVVDDHVVEIPAVAPVGSPLGSVRDMVSLLELGPDALATADAAARAAHGSGACKGTCLEQAEVRLLAPVTHPRKIFCLAGNYAEHIIEGGGRPPEAEKATPHVFMKPPSTVVRGTNDVIPIPPVGQSIDWEGELAIVIGRRAKAVKAEEALDFVAGYTCMNDVSERELLIKERAETGAWESFFDWLNGKWLDGFGPQGPYLVTTDEIPNPHALDLRVRVNGETMQQGNTGQMLFRVGDIIEYISAICTLEPGDLISTGTPSGVGHARGLKLKPGDTVEVEIEKIGVLRSTVVTEG